MKDYESLTCLEIKQILKKHKVCGYSTLCKQELVKLAKKTLNNKKIKKGGNPNGNDAKASQRNNERRETEERIEENYKNAKRELNSFLKEKLTPYQASMITINISEITKRCLKKNGENNINKIQGENLQTSIADLRAELLKEQNNVNVSELMNNITVKIRNLMVNYGIYCMMKLRKEQEQKTNN